MLQRFIIERDIPKVGALLTAKFLGVTVNDGWSPGPADLTAPLSSYKGATGAAVGPERLRKINPGHASGAGVGL